ncbi:MAG TPA: cytochrome P450 [Gemmatimonadales bacterium]|nr:cytochrome P450 [Gemmatimonadales bacterium]
MEDYPETTALDLVRLGVRAAGAALLHPRSFDIGLVLHEWLGQMTVRHRSPNVRLKLPAVPMLLVTDREVSRQVLAAQPRHDAYGPGTMKRKGMSYLAPRALTIAEDGDWARLRPFNERVLCAGRPHEFQTVFLGHVRRAFAGPVASVEDIRERMGRAMLAIVFGDGVAPDRLAAEVRAVFALVQNPVKRKLAGERGRRRVAALYRDIRRVWNDGHGVADASLLGLARNAGAGEDVEVLLQQVPHWMFTFTGSGSDLLTRGLAMIGSRPDVLRRARDELPRGNKLDDAPSIGALRYLEGCLLEGARLYPPVRFTMHRAGAEDSANGARIAPGTELLQVFSLTQRDRGADPTADDFRPERWLSARPQAEAMYPNLFLSGARRCPGRDLILFVCKSAAAHLLQAGLVVGNEKLTTDPVPFSFPTKGLEFRTPA